MSSRLFQEVRESRGLCYTIYAFSSGLTDSGMFAVYAASGPDRADEPPCRDPRRAAPRGRHRLHRKEIDRVKAQLKMGLLPGWKAPARAPSSLRARS